MHEAIVVTAEVAELAASRVTEYFILDSQAKARLSQLDLSDNNESVISFISETILDREPFLLNFLSWVAEGLNLSMEKYSSYKLKRLMGEIAMFDEVVQTVAKLVRAELNNYYNSLSSKSAA